MVFYKSSDYIGIDTEKYSFYYGYEFSRIKDEDDPEETRELWGFRVRENGNTIFEIPNDDCDTKFNVTENLVKGMAQFIEHQKAQNNE